MIQYARYFNEWETPAAGIDTISIWVNPDIISRDTDFHAHGNIHEAVNCRYKNEECNGRIIRKNRLIDIQSEAINPNFDILTQILHILTSFVYNGTLQVPDAVSMSDMPAYLAANFDRFFSIAALDFHFDFREGDCVIRGEEDPRYPGTFYSKDYPSSLKTYNRIKRLQAKNHIPHEKIMEMEYTRRIEFHLSRGNCDRLACQNLQGTFEVVFLWFLPLLARKWFDYHRQVVDVPNLSELPYAHHYRQIVDVALAGHIPQYRSLQKAPKKPVPCGNRNNGNTEW